MQNNVDFTFGQYKRSSLYLKRSKGAPIPESFTWQCPNDGTMNPLSSQEEQYCPKCGVRLRLQEQKDEDPRFEGEPLSPGSPHRYTLVRVAHFSIYPDKGKEIKNGI